MPYNKFSLPEYPVCTDMWEELKRETRPIVVYGMGNGADKLFERFSLYGIRVSDVFASDGFVRGHSYRGYLIKSFTEIRETYPDFVIVLSFATGREEVLYMLRELDMRYDMYIPDMPVAGVDEYFDKDFYNENYEKILSAYNAFEEEKSRNLYAAIINYKLSGKMKYLVEAYSEKAEIYSLLSRKNIEIMIDAGAYNGDTAREAIRYFPGLRTVYAIEPDKRNFKKLTKYSEAETACEIITINAAAWCEDSSGVFFGSGNRNSTINATASFEHKENEVALLKIDSITDEKIDYIKYDVEGAEREALLGSDGTIKKHLPTLLISLYHRSRDIFEIVNTMRERYPEYSLYLRRLMCVPAWEIDLIMVKK